MEALARKLLRITFVRNTLILQSGRIIYASVRIASSVIVVQVLGPQQYGTYQLVLIMHSSLMALNLSGLDLSTITRLSEAIATGNRALVRDLAAFYVQVSLLIASIGLLLACLGGVWFAKTAYGDASIGKLLCLYTLILFIKPVYMLVLLTAQSMKTMGRYTALLSIACLIEEGVKIAVVVGEGGVTELIAAHLSAALLITLASLWLYQRWQHTCSEHLPTLSEVVAAVRRNSPRVYWRFGILLAIDRNVSTLYKLLPLQMLGIWAGKEAVGFLKLGISAVQYPSTLFKSILLNLEVYLPASLAQQDYYRLQANFRRVVTWMIPISLAIFGLYALAAPVVVLLLGHEYTPVVNITRILCVYGIVTGIGGVFGPLYRSLRCVIPIILAKVTSLALVAIPAIWLVQHYGAAGAAWVINTVYLLSVSLTILIIWPRVMRLDRTSPDHSQHPEEQDTRTVIAP